MLTLTFNRVHKNGWVSIKLPGVPGAVYIDKRMFSVDPASVQSIQMEVPEFKAPGEGVSEAAAAKAAKKLELEQKKAEKAAASAAKAQARLEKLQAQADKAAAAAQKAQAKLGGGTSAEASS